MAAETQYTANTGMVTISTANTNLDGTGTLGTVLTAASNGTLIKSIRIKAQVSTTQGMIRLFIDDTTNKRIIAEIEVPAVTKNAEDPSFEAYLETDFALVSGDILKASTEKGEAFNVIAEGLDWAYYASSVRPESTNYTANTGNGNVVTANTNLDGSGTIATILTAGVAASGWKGCSISSISIKAQVSTTAGMVRIYVYDGTTSFLITEVHVPATTKSATAQSFGHRVTFNGNGLMIKAGYAIKASTEKGESMNVIAEGADWKYPA